MSGQQDEKLNEGVDLFAAGDVAGATRIWLDALTTSPTDQRVLSYVRYVQKLSPQILKQVEGELGKTLDEILYRPPEPIEVVTGETSYYFNPAAARAVHGQPTAEYKRSDLEPEEELGPHEPTLVTANPLADHEVDVDVDAIDVDAVGESEVIDESQSSDLSPPPLAPPVVQPAPFLLGETDESKPEPSEEVDLSSLVDGTETADFEPLGNEEPTGPFVEAPSPPQLAFEDDDDLTDDDGGLEGWGFDKSNENQAGPVETSGFTLVEAVSETAVIDSQADHVQTLEARLKQFLELDDLTHALEVAEQLLALEPLHELGLKSKVSCRDKLLKMCESKVGDLKRKPVVLLAPDQLVWQDLDHRAGFILSQVDGASSFEDILIISSMDRLEAMRILAHLIQDGVIGLD